MTENPHEAWDPRSPAVLTDQIAAYDSMRRQTPIAYSDFLGWSVFHHADTVRIFIIAHYLSTKLEVQARLRGDPSLVPAAIDEILRIHAPLIPNRWVTTRQTEVGGLPRTRMRYELSTPVADLLSCHCGSVD